MPRLTLLGKVDRVMRLLLGLRHPGVASALASAGFTAAEIDEGYALLRALTVADMKDAADLEPTGASAVEERIAPWMRPWIPVARAALRRRHPKLESAIFAHKGQSPPGSYSVATTFITRWTELGDPKGRWAPDGVAARKLLAARGLTREVVDELRRLIEVRKATPRRWRASSATRRKSSYRGRR